MTITAPLTEAEVHQFVDTWYHSLDIHVPLEDFLSMVADDGIEFRFPEVTVTDKAGLTEWYQRVTRTFFNEKHETRELTITTQGDSAIVKIVTHWLASVWNPPAPRSEQLAFFAGQTWRVVRSAQTGQPVVVSYIVDSFEPEGDSSALPVKDTVTQ